MFCIKAARIFQNGDVKVLSLVFGLFVLFHRGLFARVVKMPGDVVSKETVCCVGGKVKH